MGICLYLREWRERVRVDAGVRYLSAGMSTRPCTILKNIISLFLVLLDSRVSHSRWSNIEVTLLVLWYLFVTYLAAVAIVYFKKNVRINCPLADNNRILPFLQHTRKHMTNVCCILSFFLLILARSNFDHYARECNFGILKKKQKQNKKKKTKQKNKNKTKKTKKSFGCVFN